MRVTKEAKETRTVEETYAVVCAPEKATEIESDIRVFSNGATDEQNHGESLKENERRKSKVALARKTKRG